MYWNISKIFLAFQTHKKAAYQYKILNTVHPKQDAVQVFSYILWTVIHYLEREASFYLVGLFP